MTRILLSISAALALLLVVPNLAQAHCGSCGVGDEAAADEGHAGCAFCQGDETAECTCAHGAEEGGDAEGDDGAAEEGDEGAAGEGDDAEGGHASCAFCQGDETAECTCAHGG